MRRMLNKPSPTKPSKSMPKLAGSGVEVGDPVRLKVTPIDPLLAENVSGATKVRKKEVWPWVTHTACAMLSVVGFDVIVDS